MNAQDPQAAIDLSRAPRGEIAAAELVAAVAKVGDLAERHYLELKGPADLVSKTNKQKVAKFILGASNRLTEKAMEAFEGCAVMVLGITKDGIKGLPPIEMLELSKVVQPFLGVPGPRWDIFRVPVENSANQVLVLVVEPPVDGQPVYICRDNGDGLTDGRVYIRAEGETREATSAEQDAIRERAAHSSAPAPVDLAVTIVGEVVPIFVDDEATLEEHIATVRNRLLNAMPAHDPSKPITIGTEAKSDGEERGVGRNSSLENLAATLSRGVMFASTPETRTFEAYRAAIDEWEGEVRSAWPRALRVIAGYVDAPAEVSIENRTSTFLHDVEVKVHLEGAVEVVDHAEMPRHLVDIDLGLPDPPRQWGPIRPNPLAGMGLNANLYGSNLYPSNFIPPDASWRNSGSVDVEVSVGDLRPKATFATDDVESVLVVFGEEPQLFTGTWEATVRGYNQVFDGPIEVKTEPARDLTSAMRTILGLKKPDGDDDDDAEDDD